MYTKSILLRLIVAILITGIFISTIACIKIVRKPALTDQTDSKDALTSLEANLNKYDFGKVNVVDSNKDGKPEQYVYAFETQKLDEDLYLDKKVQFDNVGNAYNGKVVLQFKYTGNTDKVYRHVETIPKSFANNVNMIKFSVPPTKIIKADPEVEWEIRCIKSKGKEMTEIYYNALFSDYYDPDYTLGNPATAITYLMLTRFDDFAFLAGLDKCSKLTGAQQVDCRLALVERFPKNFTETACKAAFWTDEGDHLYWRICQALVSGNINKCGELQDEANADLCKGYIIEKKCAGISNLAEREKCFYDDALENGCTTACLEINDPDRQNLCLAKVTGDQKYCNEIKSAELKRYCSGEESKIDLSKYKSCEIHFSFASWGTDLRTKGQASGNQFKGRADYVADGFWGAGKKHVTGNIIASVTGKTTEFKDSEVDALTATWTEKYPDNTYDYTLVVRNVPFREKSATTLWYGWSEKDKDKVNASLVSFILRVTSAKTNKTEERRIYSLEYMGVILSDK